MGTKLQFETEFSFLCLYRYI